MSLTHIQHRQSEQGFTLVELAIVMVIIGLLIGGILKGQELIANARISSTVSQVKGLDAALNTFQDKYNALPGDINNPTTRLSGCTAAPCNDAGDGDGRIGTSLTTVPTNSNEEGVMFAHLSAADLVSGVDVTGSSATFGRMLPQVKAGGGMWVSYGAAQVAGSLLTIGRHYAVLNGTVAAPTASTGTLSSTVAAQIDRKLDDGRPLAGAVQTIGTGCATAANAQAAYDESSTTATCAMFARVLN
jgi:prepilin-type N-terminal cleavage/methylation domain-containing protein